LTKLSSCIVIVWKIIGGSQAPSSDDTTLVCVCNFYPLSHIRDKAETAENVTARDILTANHCPDKYITVSFCRLASNESVRSRLTGHKAN
jgi:hypothetical protein